MDETLQQLRRNATTKEDTLELLARSSRAGSEALHSDTHAALDRFPTDEDIIKEWADAHCKAIVYLKSDPHLEENTLWVYGIQGKQQLHANVEHERQIIVDRTDIHILRQMTGNYRSLFSSTQSVNLPPGGRVWGINDIVTTPEGSFVHSSASYGIGGIGCLSGQNRITNTRTGEEKDFAYERNQYGRAESTLCAFFPFEGKLTYSIAGMYYGGDGERLSEEKQVNAHESLELRFRNKLFPKQTRGSHQPYSKESWRYFPLLGEVVEYARGQIRMQNLWREENVLSAKPISQHFYEKLLQKYAS